MIKINWHIIIILIVFIQICGCNSHVMGKYVNKNDQKIINYLQLNPDMTYIHFYKKNNVTLSQKGTWIYRKTPYKGLDLYQFCDYNENGENYKKYAVYILIIDGNRLNIGFDGDTASSFERD